MSNKQVNQLPEITTLAASDKIPVQRASDNQTSYIKGSNLAAGGWSQLSLTSTPSVTIDDGPRQYYNTFNDEIGDILYTGTKLKAQRSTIPTLFQCASFDGSTQYGTNAAPAGMTNTDDITVLAWIFPDEIDGTNDLGILSRGTSTGGWSFFINEVGRITLTAGNTSNFDNIQSYRSVPFRRWSHVGASVDMSGAAGKTFLNGIQIDALYTNSAATTFTNSGTLYLGFDKGIANTHFDGFLSEVSVWTNGSFTEAQVQALMNEEINVGGVVNLQGYWKLQGNLNDSSANANTLTAVGSLVATIDAHPFSEFEYAEVMTVSEYVNGTDVTMRSPDNVVFSDESGMYTNWWYSYDAAPHGLCMSNIIDSAEIRANFATTSASDVIASGLTVKLAYTPSIDGVLHKATKRLRVSFNGTIQASTTQTVTLKIWEGTVGSGKVAAIRTFTSDAATQNTPAHIEVEFDASFGDALTFNMSVATSAGTATIVTAYNSPATLTLEFV